LAALDLAGALAACLAGVRFAGMDLEGAGLAGEDFAGAGLPGGCALVPAAARSRTKSGSGSPANTNRPRYSGDDSAKSKRVCVPRDSRRAVAERTSAVLTVATLGTVKRALQRGQSASQPQAEHSSDGEKPRRFTNTSDCSPRAQIPMKAG